MQKHRRNTKCLQWAQRLPAPPCTCRERQTRANQSRERRGEPSQALWRSVGPETRSQGLGRRPRVALISRDQTIPSDPRVGRRCRGPPCQAADRFRGRFPVRTGAFQQSLALSEKAWKDNFFILTTCVREFTVGSLSREWPICTKKEKENESKWQQRGKQRKNKKEKLIKLAWKR